MCLKERKLGVTKPRLRERGGSEVAVPAYAAMQENGMSQRMLDVLMRGISTRQYAEVLPEMASTCGVSKSTVSREAAEAGEAALQELAERRFEGIDLLVIYIDGMQFGEHHVIRPWVWIGPDTSTCWVCSRERQKTRRRSRTYWSSSWRVGWTRKRSACS